MIGPWDVYRSTPRISREAFARILRERAAPGVLTERDPRAYYDAISRFAIDPLYILAKFGKESTFGREGMATLTHSWGNTKNPAHGGVPIIGWEQQWLNGRLNAEFPVFRDWLDGCISTTARLVEHDVYAGRTMIGEIYSHPSDLVWAPAGDHNDPEGYLRFILDFMNRHQDLPGTIHIPQPPPLTSNWIPVGAPNRDGRPLTAAYVTIHDTGNTRDMADAENHADYLRDAARNVPASWHATVDDDSCVLNLPWNEVAYHAGDGDGPGNLTSEAIELCINGDGNFWKTGAFGAALAADRLLANKLPIERLVQHNHWKRRPAAIPPGEGPHKDCPRRLRHDGLWPAFTDLVVRRMATHGVAPRPFRYFSETRHWLGGGFQSAWDSVPQAYYLIGPPLSEEFTRADGVTCQVFQKLIGEHRPDWPAWNPGHIYFMNVAQDSGLYQDLYPEAFTPKEGPR